MTDYSELSKADRDKLRGNRGGSWNGVDRNARGPRIPRPKGATQREKCVYCTHTCCRACACCSLGRAA